MGEILRGRRFHLLYAVLAGWMLGLAAFLALFPPRGEAAPQEGREVRSADALRVVGEEITYKGAPVRLRGVATMDVYDMYLSGRDPAADYARLANDWKANVVRIGVHPSTWRRYKAKTLALLREHTNAALDAGLFVIIDYHVIGFPDGYYQRVPASWGAPADLYDSDFALATDFWRTVSRNIRDGRVMFELWNEPVYEENELSPEQPGASKWRRLKPYMRRLTNTIRSGGNGAVILASGNHWAFNLRGIKDNLLPDRNTAYTWHVYAGNSGNDPSRWAYALGGLDRVKPVLVTEWGFEPGTSGQFRGTARTFGNKFRDGFLEGRKLHSIAWNWSPYYGPEMLRGDWKTRTTWGEFVYDYLRAKNTNPVRPQK